MMESVTLPKVEKIKGAPIQTRLKDMIIELIRSGRLNTGAKLPSTRSLCRQMSISRNTAMIVYEKLIEEGYVQSENRRGYFVTKMASPQPSTMRPVEKEITDHFTVRASEFSLGVKPENWRKLKYPFISGQIDSSHFPSADWSSCMKIVCRKHFLEDWNTDLHDKDDPHLTDQLRMRILPERGIWASPDEIIITSGSQHALFMTAYLLLDSGKTVGIESPGYIDFRHICRLFTEKLQPIAIDREGAIPSNTLNKCDLVCLTPSFQSATTVTMSSERRRQWLEAAKKHDFMLLEDDYESDLIIGEGQLRTLKAMDESNRVIYCGSLSKTIAPGIRMGFIVAHRDIIREIRAIRRLNLRHPPLNNQRTVALFIGQGYYFSNLRRLSKVYRSRWELLRQSLAKHTAELKIYNSKFGGSSAWVEAPDSLDVELLASKAWEKGIYFENGRAYYHNPEKAPSRLKLGYSSIKEDNIEKGVQELGELLPQCHR